MRYDPTPAALVKVQNHWGEEDHRRQGTALASKEFPVGIQPDPHDSRPDGERTQHRVAEATNPTLFQKTLGHLQGNPRPAPAQPESAASHLNSQSPRYPFLRELVCPGVERAQAFTGRTHAYTTLSATYDHSRTSPSTSTTSLLTSEGTRIYRVGSSKSTPISSSSPSSSSSSP